MTVVVSAPSIFGYVIYTIIVSVYFCDSAISARITSVCRNATVRLSTINFAEPPEPAGVCSLDSPASNAIVFMDAMPDFIIILPPPPAPSLNPSLP